MALETGEVKEEHGDAVMFVLCMAGSGLLSAEAFPSLS